MEREEGLGTRQILHSYNKETLQLSAGGEVGNTILEESHYTLSVSLRPSSPHGRKEEGLGTRLLHSCNREAGREENKTKLHSQASWRRGWYQLVLIIL